MRQYHRSTNGYLPWLALIFLAVAVVLLIVATYYRPVTPDQPPLPTIAPVATLTPTLPPLVAPTPAPTLTAFVVVPVINTLPAVATSTPMPTVTALPVPTAEPDVIPAQMVLATVTPMLRPPPPPAQLPRRDP